jgi:hypothetical protein
MECIKNAYMKQKLIKLITNQCTRFDYKFFYGIVDLLLRNAELLLVTADKIKMNKRTKRRD